MQLSELAGASALDLLPYGVLLLDGSNRVVDVNPAGGKLLHQTKTQLLSQHISQILPLPPSTPLNTPFELTLIQKKQAITLQLQRISYTTGQLITFHEVTAYTQTIADLTQQEQTLIDLVAFTRSTAQGKNLYGVLQNAIKGTIRLTQAETGSLVLLDSDHDLAQSILMRGEEIIDEDMGFLRTVVKEGLVSWIITHHQPVLIHDTLEDERWLPSGPVASRTVLSAPILYQGTLLGVLTLIHSKPNQFSGKQLGLIQVATDQVAVILQNAQLYEAERQFSAQRDKLYQFLKTVGQTLQLKEMAERAVELLAELTGWPTIEIYSPTETANGLELLASRSFAMTKETGSLTTSKNLAFRAFQTRKIQTIPHDIAPGTLYSHYQALALPLQLGGHLCGVFSAVTYATIPFDKNEVLLAKAMSEALALALRNAQLYESAQQQLYEQTVLHQAISSITSTLDVSTILTQVAQHIAQAFKLTSAYIYSYEPATTTSTLLAEYISPLANEKEAVSDYGHVYQLDHSFPTVNALVSTNKIGAIHSDSSDLTPTERQHLTIFGGKSCLIIPMKTSQEVIAYAVLWEGRRKQIFSETAITLAQTMTQQATIVLQNAQLFQSIAEERGHLEALILSSEDGIVLIGLDAQIRIVNQNALTMLRLSGTPQAWQNKHLISALWPMKVGASEAVKTIIAGMREVVTGHEPPSQGEFVADNDTIHWSSRVVNNGLEPIGRLVLLRDITKLRLAEKVRTDLTRTMVHDLQSPMSTAHTSLDFVIDLDGQNLSQTSQRFLDIAKNNISKAGQLVNSILDISRLERGVVPLDRQLFSIGELFESIATNFSPLALNKEIAIVTELEPGLITWSDWGLTERVLYNLVDNSLKFTPTMGQITIRARAVDEAIYVSIQDTGSGIPVPLQARIFDTFVTGSQKERGSGLGLAYCRLAVEAHGQQIWIENSSPAGTTFTFTLPTPPETIP